MIHHHSCSGPKTEARRGTPWWAWVITLVSLGWFAVRVLPKPSRAAYPCQRMAVATVGGFGVWLLGVAGLTSLLHHALHRLRRHPARFLPVVLLALGAVGAWMLFAMPARDSRAAEPTEGPNAPIGVARGISPGRVTWSYDPDATSWSGDHDGTHWYDAGQSDQARVDAMLSAGLRALTRTSSDAAAWDALFRSFNQRRGVGDVGYAASSRKLIAVKINQNPTNQGNNAYYANNGVAGDEYAITANPHLILALVKSLVAAGVAEEDVLFIDATGLNRGWGGPRTIGDNIYNYVHAEYPGVRFVDGVGEQGREVAQWPATDQIQYATGKGGDESKGKKIAQQLLDAGFIINMPILKDHGDGPTVAFKNHYGSVSGQRHGPIYGNGSNYYSNTVEPMGHQELGEKTLLYVVDALYGAPSPNAAPTKWTNPPFDGDWPSSVFLSQDAVATDSVAFDFMNAEWGLTQDTDYYLHEAASVPDGDGRKLSGTVYQPTIGSADITGSLGVHEHWNDDTLRQYSRNLDPATGQGIDLCRVDLTNGTCPGDPPVPTGTGGAGTGTGGAGTGTGASPALGGAGGLGVGGTATGTGSTATGTGSTATGTGSTATGSNGDAADDSGCSCRATGSGAPSSRAWLLGALALGALAMHRRRSRAKTV